MSAVKVKIYSTQGKVVGEQDLSAAIFNVPMNEALLHQVIVGKLANSRKVLAKVKDRSEVRGGGKKPWKQKGTGRARHGSIRSPLWSGGGVTFGPTGAQRFSKLVNKKQRKKALYMVLSDKVKHDRIVVIDELKLEKPKTKQLQTWLNALPSKGKPTTLITSTDDANVIIACKNLVMTHSLGVTSLNAADLLRYEYIIIPKSALQKLEKVYGT